MRPLTRRVFLSAPLALATAACARPQPPLVVATNRWIGYEPFYIARELEAYPGRAPHLVEFGSASEVVRALASGVIDAGALTLDEALQLMQHNPDFAVGLVLYESFGADALVASGGLKSPAALRGRRVGADSLALGAFMLGRALQYGGLAPSDVKLVHVSYEAQLEALDAGEVDALVTFEPVLGQLTARGARVLFDSSDIPGEVVDVLVVRQQALADRDGRLAALLQGWFAGRDALLGSEPAALAAVSARQQIAPDEVKPALQQLRFPSLQENRHRFAEKATLLESMRRMHALLAGFGLVEGAPPGARQIVSLPEVLA